MRVCSEPGCGVLIPKAGYCTAHKRERDARRGRRQDRGYDAEHDRQRRAWQKRLDAGERIGCHNPSCVKPTVLIDPRDWHLGHTPNRNDWRGPEHPGCNLAEAGRASHA